MRVLVVDDDRALGVFLQKTLTFEGHEVLLAGDGETAMALVAQQEPDLVVLELGILRWDGTEVLAALRRDMPNLSMLVVTAQSEECVRCLNMGADDFLAKPFNPLEMMSRCRSLLRRRSHYTAPRLCFGRVELNRVDHTVTYDGVPIDLSTQECKLLEFMVQLQGKRFTRSELLPQMGQSMPAANPHLGCAPVNYPRRKLSVAAPVYRSTDSAIVTVCGVGYRLQCTCHGPKPCLVHPSRPILKSPQQS